MIRPIVLFVSIYFFFPSFNLLAQASIENICSSIYNNDNILVKYSSQNRDSLFSSYKHYINNTTFQSYQDFISKAQNSGLFGEGSLIDVVDVAFDFSNEAKSNSHKFREELEIIKKQTFEESSFSRMSDLRISRLANGVNEVMIKCIEAARDVALEKSRSKVFIHVEGSRQSSNFIVTVSWEKGTPEFELLGLQGLENNSCIYSGKKPKFPIKLKPTSSSISFSCQKTDSGEVTVTASTEHGDAPPLIVPQKITPLEKELEKRIVSLQSKLIEKESDLVSLQEEYSNEKNRYETINAGLEAELTRRDQAPRVALHVEARNNPNFINELTNFLNTHKPRADGIHCTFQNSTNFFLYVRPDNFNAQYSVFVSERTMVGRPNYWHEVARNIHQGNGKQLVPCGLNDDFFLWYIGVTPI